jgi:hypothetical protein
MASSSESHPTAMTDGAITVNEALASALDAIGTSHGAAGASVGCVKSTPPVLRVDFSERHSVTADEITLMQVPGLGAHEGATDQRDCLLRSIS